MAQGGLCKIPKTVFEPLPAEAGSSSSVSGGGKVTQVKRLDGTVQEVVTGLPPNNPNFVPRQCWPGGKILTNDKLEVQLKFYERKGLPLTPELEAKKAELEAAEAAAKATSGGVKQRLGKGKARAGVPGGRVVTLGGAEGAVQGKGAEAAVAAPPVVAPKAAPEQSAWYKNRPKGGGVKVLGGAEGALTTTSGKRVAGEQPSEQPTAKK